MMDFVTASDRLADCPTHSDLAAVLAGATEERIPVLVQRIRQARLDPSHANRRPAPEGWESAIATLARGRAAELVKLAGELER